MTGRREPVGLIAGSGRMPFLVAAGIRRLNRPIVTAGFRRLASMRLKAASDEFRWVALARIGAWISLFRRHDVHEAVMIGGVTKKAMYSPLRLVRYIPDIRAARLWYHTLQRDKSDSRVLMSVANELRNEGIELVSCVKYCREHLAHEGVMTATPIPRRAQADVEFGWRIARASAELDIGQALAVKESAIIAVEAMEGTDAMIRRAGRVCRVGGWTLVKVARPRQDMRFDVPAIGPETLRNLRDAKCVCVVVEAEKTLIVDKPTTLALADRLKLAIVGKLADEPES